LVVVSEALMDLLLDLEDLVAVVDTVEVQLGQPLLDKVLLVVLVVVLVVQVEVEQEQLETQEEVAVKVLVVLEAMEQLHLLQEHLHIMLAEVVVVQGVVLLQVLVVLVVVAQQGIILLDMQELLTQVAVVEELLDI
jgi:hypothetical protein